MRRWEGARLKWEVGMRKVEKTEGEKVGRWEAKSEVGRRRSDAKAEV